MNKSSGRGYICNKKGDMKIAVAFPADLFAKIKTRALKENRSVSAQVVELCKVGEFDLTESDQHECQ